jgi:uncharacterized protein
VNQTGNMIVTYTGKMINPLDLKPEDVSIEDIAHSLSNLCRYTGHTNKFYSVAEHSVLVSYFLGNVDKDGALCALLHDSCEAYVGDLSRPLQTALGITDAVQELQCKINLTILQGLGLKRCTQAAETEIYRTDNNIIKDELNALTTYKSEPWQNVKVEGWAPAYARMRFIERFQELGGKLF